MIVPYHIGSFTKMRRILEPRYVYKRGCSTDDCPKKLFMRSLCLALYFVF